MAQLTHGTINKVPILDDYTLKLNSNDRVRVEINGEYVTYATIVNGKLYCLGSEKIEVL